MSSLRAPNHPATFSSHFQPLATSTTESARANQYGFVKTSSYFQCGGIGDDKRENFQVELTANTALNNVLEVGSIYSISGKMIAMNDGSPPLLTYSHDIVTRVASTSDDSPDFVNKTFVSSLGMITHRQEVVAEMPDASVSLEVTVAHSDWDAEARCIKRFNIKYIVPGTKNMIKTHTLYVVGREVNILGRLVDFDMDLDTAVVLVKHVSVTNGHQIGKVNGFGGNNPTPGTLVPITKFSPKKAEPLPSTSGSKSASQATPTKTPKITARGANRAMSNQESGLISTISKGKQKAAPQSDAEDDDEDKSEDSDESDGDLPAPPPPKSKRGRPRKLVLQEAAKRLKNQ